MTKKAFILICMVMIAASVWGQRSGGLDMPLPQFSNPFYDSFSRNFTGTVASGRGYTGVAKIGDLTGYSLNPAVHLPDSAKIFIELNIKPQIDAYGYTTEASYTSPVPFGLLAISRGFGRSVSAGIAYGLPKSIRLDDYSIFINQSANMVQRFPSYYLHQITANMAYHKGPMHYGLNLHNQIHYVDDPIFLRSYDRVRSYKYGFRVQPGLVYENEDISLGLSATAPTRFDWDIKYRTYDIIQPLKVNAGVCYNRSNYTFLAESEFEQFSKISPEFKDRISYKAGMEKHFGWYSYRLGYMYSSQVYAGRIKLAVNTVNPDSTSVFWNQVPTSLLIDSNAQHFLSGGLSYMHRDGSINVSLIQSVSKEAPQTQLGLSLSFYLHSFKRKGFLYFDD